MIKLKDLLKEWTDTSFRDLPKRWSKPVMKGREPDGLTEFERLGGTMRIRKDNPKARKSFRARHNCDTPGPRHKARYWSCRKW